MKTRYIALFLLVALAVPAMTGCQTQAAERKMESAGRAVENRVEAAGDKVKQAVDPTADSQESHPAPTGKPALSLEEVQEIALKHAGLTADQVTALHTEYEVEHGVPQYDVEFHHETWEYDYEIHADTGEVLSFSKDD